MVDLFREIMRAPPMLLAATNAGLITVDVRSRNLGEVLLFKVITIHAPQVDEA